MDIDAMFRTFRPQTFHPMVQFFLTSIAAMLVLALLDFIGAVFAKEWADTRQLWWFVAGLVTFMGLFAFYATSSENRRALDRHHRVGRLPPGGTAAL